MPEKITQPGSDEGNAQATDHSDAYGPTTQVMTFKTPEGKLQTMLVAEDGHIQPIEQPPEAPSPITTVPPSNDIRTTLAEGPIPSQPGPETPQSTPQA